MQGIDGVFDDKQYKTLINNDMENLNVGWFIWKKKIIFIFKKYNSKHYKYSCCTSRSEIFDYKWWNIRKHRKKCKGAIEFIENKF